MRTDADGIFHISADNELVSMAVTPYEAEDILPRLLESHPDLLAGGQMTPYEPRRWALVKREQGVPDRDNATTRWSIDHLFVDQDAVPTLVEVKRSSDRRIRREVVGQMLDYAANGVRYWPVADLQLAFEATQRGLGHDPQDSVAELVGDRTVTVDDFFGRVADNLRAGRIRMVFVADVIPDELMRITEFLNEQMSPADVFAVEVKQYKAPGHDGTVIVPAVYGRTATASVKPSQRSAPGRDVLLDGASADTHEVLERLVAFAGAAGGFLEESPGGAVLRSASSKSVATLYLGYDSLDFSVQPLRDLNLVAEADDVLARLQAMTSKQLTAKFPSMPSADIVARWPEVEPILEQMCGLHASGPS